MFEFALGIMVGVAGYELLRQWWTGALSVQTRGVVRLALNTPSLTRARRCLLGQVRRLT